MDSKRTDRNLIIGVMAIQLNCVTPSQSIAAMQAWIFQRELLPKDRLLSLRSGEMENRSGDRPSSKPINC